MHPREGNRMKQTSKAIRDRIRRKSIELCSTARELSQRAALLKRLAAQSTDKSKRLAEIAAQLRAA